VSDAGNDPRTEVSLGCRILGAQDQGDLIWGHVSKRDVDGRGVWMKAASFGFEEVDVDQVILVDDAGNVVDGDGRRHIEFPIHTEIMAARSDVRSVVHTHAPHAVALGATDQALLPISHEGTLFVPPDVARFTATGDLIMTRELGRKVAEGLGERNALLLVNHGIVTVGPDVPTAVLTAILLERACQIQLLAASGGQISLWSSGDEALAKREHCYSTELLHQAWDYLVRRLDR
jgi:L-fuculose-phosphate aldolase